MDTLRYRLSPDSDLVAGLVGGGLVFLEVTGTLVLWLVNGEGPFDQRRWPGWLVALPAGAVVGGLVLAAAYVVGRRSTLALVALAVVLGTAVWTLLPHRVDVHESFAPRPDEQWSCRGLEFSRYPVATMDASSTVWCVGLEHPTGGG